MLRRFMCSHFYPYNLISYTPTPLHFPTSSYCSHPYLPTGNTPYNLALPDPIPVSQHPFFTADIDTPFLSTHSKQSVTQAIQSAWATSTVKRYSGAVKQFIHFCNVEGIPHHLCFPADEFLLCAFAASSLGRHSRGTVRNRLSALKAWHISHNMEWKGSARLRYVLNGIHNSAPGHSKHPPRPPITIKMLTQLIECLDLTSPLDVTVAACAVTAFWGQCRLGELLSLLHLLFYYLFPFPLALTSKDHFATPIHAFSIYLVLKLTVTAKTSSSSTSILQ